MRLPRWSAAVVLHSSVELKVRVSQTFDRAEVSVPGVREQRMVSQWATEQQPVLLYARPRRFR